MIHKRSKMKVLLAFWLNIKEFHKIKDTENNHVLFFRLLLDL